MSGKVSASGVVLCALAVAVSFATADEPFLAWWVSWISGVLILAAAIRGRLFQIPGDVPWRYQILRPWFLLTAIFCVYNFLTSVFFALDVMGRPLLGSTSRAYGRDVPGLLAEAQRNYLIGQIGLLYGCAVFAAPRHRPCRALSPNIEITGLLMKVGLIASACMLIFEIIPGLSQFSVKARGVMVLGWGLSLGFAYRNARSLLPLSIPANLLLGALALSSGWKEEVFVLILLHAVAFFPAFPRLTSALTVILFALGFFILPPLAMSVREATWKHGGDRFEAAQQAIEDTFTRSFDQTMDIGWEFMIHRLSEIDLFTRYLRAVPEGHPHYGLTIVEQGALTPVPRILWPEKPDSEMLVRSRVIELGVVDRNSYVSAKPQFVVDAWLSFGPPGVFAFMFFYGCITSLLANRCELWFGGRDLGLVFFNGLFSFFWRGACFEFLINALVWSAFTAYTLHGLLAGMGVIVACPPGNRRLKGIVKQSS